MTTLTQEITELTRAIVADQRRDATARVESIDDALWQTLAEAGLTDSELLKTQEDGSCPAIAVLDSLAAAVTDLPILEHLWLGQWLLGQTDIAATGTIIPVIGDDITRKHIDDILVVVGEMKNVAWANAAETFLLLFEDGTVCAVPASEAVVSVAGGMGGAPVATVSLPEIRLDSSRVSSTTSSVAQFHQRLVVGRLIQARAAARAAIELAVEYAGQRVQFGRPIAKFQAVQGRIAGMFGEFAMLDSGVNLALNGTPVDISLARIDARHSVTEIHRNAHQILGAMGVTAEHLLGFLTSRMIAWLSDTGSDSTFITETREHIRDTGVWDTISAPISPSASSAR